MPVERETFDNDLAVVGVENWVESFVDCRIVVDLRLSAPGVGCMNWLHYSYLC